MCARLCWLLVSFRAHVKYLHIVWIIVPCIWPGNIGLPDMRMAYSSHNVSSFNPCDLLIGLDVFMQLSHVILLRSVDTLDIIAVILHNCCAARWSARLHSCQRHLRWRSELRTCVTSRCHVIALSAITRGVHAPVQLQSLCMLLPHRVFDSLDHRTCYSFIYFYHWVWIC